MILGGEARLHARLEESVPVEQVGEIGFAVGRCWQLSLPGDGPPSFLTSDDGAAWQRLPDPPVRDPGAAAVGLFPHGSRISVFESEVAHIHSEEAGWRTLDLPRGTDWVAAGVPGEWWAVGSRPATRVRTAEREVAAWRCRERDGRWTSVPIMTSWWDAVRVIRDGGFERFRAVDARHRPVVLASECAWFLDDPSWFLFTEEPSGRFRVQRLPGRRLIRLDRSRGGAPVALTSDGEIWDWSRGKWRPRGGAESLAGVLSPFTDFRRYAVHLAVGDPDVYGVVTLFASEAPQRMAVESPDGGRSWRLRNLGGPGDRLVVAAWAVPG